jgi:hypothetical protein
VQPKESTLQNNRKNRSDGRSRPLRGRRNGPAGDFAAAIARTEFGRFYVDEARLLEAKRSVEAAIARRKPTPRPDTDLPRTVEPMSPAHTRAREAMPPAKTKCVPWKAPSVRERRTEIAMGLDRLRTERRPRSAGPEQGPT